MTDTVRFEPQLLILWLGLAPPLLQRSHLVHHSPPQSLDHRLLPLLMRKLFWNLRLDVQVMASWLRSLVVMYCCCEGVGGCSFWRPKLAKILFIIVKGDSAQSVLSIATFGFLLAYSSPEVRIVWPLWPLGSFRIYWDLSERRFSSIHALYSNFWIFNCLFLSRSKNSWTLQIFQNLRLIRRVWLLR